jgi:hypothetical protein
MATGEMAYLAMVIAAVVTFGLSLAYAATTAKKR